MELLFALLFTFPVVAILLLLLLTTFKYRVAQLQIIFSLIYFVIILLTFLNLKQPIIYQVSAWQSPFAISLMFDKLSLLMLLLFSFTSCCVLVFSSNHLIGGQGSKAFSMGYWFLFLGISGALLTHDLFNLYVWLEVMLVAAFILLGFNGRNNELSISYYAVLNIAGTLTLLLAIGLIYGQVGSLNYSNIHIFMQAHHSAKFMLPIVLLLVGLFVKGAIFPFYFWLPTAYPRASYISLMLLSSQVTKVVMLIVMKVCFLVPAIYHSVVIYLVVLLACLTMFLGVMGAANQYRMKSILSFHIISQLGYVLLAIAIPGKIAALAAVYFIVHNVFTKTSLFMSSSIISDVRGTSLLSELGGLIRNNKLLAVLFLVPAMSLAGFPPFSGFWAKFLVINAAITQHYYVSCAVAILVAMFTLFSMFKIWRYAFSEAGQNSAGGVSKISISVSQVIGIVPLLIAMLWIGLHPDVLFNIISQSSMLR